MTKKKTRRVPALRIHKQTARCYGTFDGETVWFGHKTDVQTQARFDAYLAEWLSRGRKLEAPRDDSLTVRSLVARYLVHLEAEHDAEWLRNSGPRVTYAMAPLLKLHGPMPAAEYGPLKLKALREFIGNATRRDGQPKLCVKIINERVRIIRNAFEWAVSEELVPSAIIEGLRAVKALRKNKPGTRGAREVRPVDRETVEATLPYLSTPVAGLVEAMWWTGARPSELFGLRPRDFDRSGKVWTVDLADHKTSDKGKLRRLHFGPQAQVVLKPFLLRPDGKPLFSPAEAVAEMYRRKREKRVTQLYPSHLARYERQ